MMRVILATILVSSLMGTPVFAQTIEDAPIMFEEAKELLLEGKYEDAVRIYDEILEITPNNISTLKMKGIVESNLERHESSLKNFFKVLQHDPDDVIALTGMGVGFGNFGEYQEAQKYFELASERNPESVVINNYKVYIDRVIQKYPYTPTEKPDAFLHVQPTKLPQWIKPIAKWWSEGLVNDSEFIDSLNYMIEKNIIQVATSRYTSNTDEQIPQWVRQTAGWWANGQINNQDFLAGIQYLVKNGIVNVDIQKSSKQIFEENKKEFSAFETYLRKISSAVGKEKRYIEYPNPSGDVIKKFLRDYAKWNFEQEAQNASSDFPDPTYEIINGVVVVEYKVFINEQPPGLPLDHVNTLRNSFAFWQNQDLETDGKKAKIVFTPTTKKHEANVWVTWIVRDLGEGVLGHAHLGKGVVEVALGDYGCDGSFQLYDVATVEYIMTHELGHSIGLQHVTDQNNIMYPSMKQKYAYCLLS